MKETLRFAVVSDIHLTDAPERERERLARDSIRIFRETREDLERLQIDYVVYAGDLFEARNQAIHHLTLAQAELRRTEAPWFVLMGNHDTRYKTTQDAYEQADFIAAFAGHGPSEGRAYWEFKVPSSRWLLVGLNTSQDFTSMGRVDPEQLAWLDALLRQNSDREVIVFMHHPTVQFDPIITEHPDFAIYLLENALEVERLLAGHRCVKLVISGHNHTSRHQEHSGLHFVGCPSINTWPNRYTLFEIRNEGASLEYRPIRDQAAIQEAKHRLIDPQSTYRKALRDPEEALRYFGSEPEQRALQFRGFLR